MNQRLYFLLPDREHALAVVNELVAQGISRQQIHALAGKGQSCAGLPDVNHHQRNNYAGQLEYWSWRANLLVFFSAAVALAILVWVQAGLWTLLPLLVMLGSFVLGERFTRLPNVHLQEFRDALRHGEILLMIDTPRARVGEVEQRVHTHHPEAIAGGSSWNVPALGT
jgi:Flp pilus assembly protein TadB